jgi:hypothetical protein
MRFTLEVDLDRMPADRREQELGRILRYWAGGLKGYELGAGATEAIYDSGHAEVGRWSITGGSVESAGRDATAHEPTGDELEQQEREEPQQPS